jgi:hypothetical protein
MKTDQLIHALVQDLRTPVARVTAALRRCLPVASGAMAVGFLAAAGIRADAFSTGFGPTVLKIALGVTLAAVGLAVAVQLARPTRNAAMAARALLIAPLAMAFIAALDLALHGNLGWQERLWGKNIWACLFMIPLLALFPLAATLHALRNGAPTNPTAAGALAGIGSAGIAILPYGLFCTENAALFIAAWYVLASCIAGVVGAMAGRRLLRW